MDDVGGAVEYLHGSTVAAIVIGVGVAAGDRVVGDHVSVAVEEDAPRAIVIITVRRTGCKHLHLVVINDRVFLDRIVAGAGRDVSASDVVAEGIELRQAKSRAFTELNAGPGAAVQLQVADRHVVARNHYAAGSTADNGRSTSTVSIDVDARPGCPVFRDLKVLSRPETASLQEQAVARREHLPVCPRQTLPGSGLRAGIAVVAIDVIHVE